MPEQRNTVNLLCFLGYLCRHSTMLFVLLLLHLVLPRFNALLLLVGVLEVLEYSEIMLSCVVLLLVFATSLSKKFCNVYDGYKQHLQYQDFVDLAFHEFDAEESLFLIPYIIFWIM